MKTDILSTSGVATRIALPDAKIVLDLGVADAVAMKCPTALITHLHADHAGAAWSWAAGGGLRDPKPRTLFCHHLVATLLRDYLEMGYRMNGNAGATPKVIGIVPNETVGLPDSPLKATAIATDHRVLSVGWAVVEGRRKLAPQFAGAPPDELIKAKAQSIPIHVIEDRVLFAYTGDTTARGLERASHSPLLEADHLVVECTYMADFPIAEARDRGHCHLDELLELAEAGLFARCGEVTLTHFSPRYTSTAIGVARALFQAAMDRYKEKVR